jgi:protein TonB
VASIEHPSDVTADEPRRLAALVAALRDMSQRRKLASLAIAIALEGLILLLLLTLGAGIVGSEDGDERETLTAIEFAAPPAPAPEPETTDASEADTPQPDQPVTQQPLSQPQRPSPLALDPVPAPEPPPPAPPRPEPSPQPTTQPPAAPKIGARIRPDAGYGPVDTGNPRTAGDSEQVGTAPNGEPLYAARWYREPTDSELAGYLSTATGPGYALIACKTVSGYYVEDCQLLSEGPAGSMIGRAVLAAAWQFRVRPARIGGREQFGSWVRIRIDYSVRRARP